MRKWIILLLITAVLFCFFGCTTTDKTDKAGSKEILTLEEMKDKSILPEELLESIASGNAEETIQILKGMDAEETVDEEGSSPLHLAALAGNAEVVKGLLAEGYDPGIKRTDGFTPIHWAAYKNSPEIIDLLAGAGGKVNAVSSDGITPLHLAVNFGAEEAAERLIYHGASPLTRQKDGLRPIDFDNSLSFGYQKKLTALIDRYGTDAGLIVFRFDDSSLAAYCDSFGPTIAQAYYTKGRDAFTSGKPDLPPYVDATLTINKSYYYLEKPVILIEAVNSGKGNAFGLWGSISLSHTAPTSYGRSRQQNVGTFPVYFGKLEPGESAVREIVLTEPGFDKIGSEMKIQVSFQEDNGYIAPELEGRVSVLNIDNRAILQSPGLFSTEEIRKLVRNGLVDRNGIDRLIHFGLKDFTIGDIVYFCENRAISQDIIENIIVNKTFPYSNADLIAIADAGYLNKSIVESLFLSGREFAPEELKKLIASGVFSLPRLGYTYMINDGDSDTSVGNKDGKIQVREGVDFVFILKNDSIFRLDDLDVSLSASASNIDLFDNTAQLTGFYPSQQEQVTAVVSVKPQFSGSSFRLNFSVKSEQFGSLLNESLYIPVGQSVGSKMISMTKKIVSTEATPVYAGADDTTPVVTRVQDGLVFDAVGLLEGYYKVKIFGQYGWVKERAVADYTETESDYTLVSAIDESRRYFENVKPEVIINSPSNNDDIDHNKVDLQLTAIDRERGIASIAVWINDELLSGSDERGLKVTGRERDRVEKSYEIPLQKGKNTVKIVAYNTDNIASEEQVLTLYSSGMKNPPRLFVLSVGVSKYENSEFDLRFASKDAEYIADIFESQAGKLFETVETKLLTDETATRQEILTQLGEFVYKARPHDVVMIFFAGHGVQRDKYYFLPHDADFNQPAVNGIDEDTLKDQLIYNIDANKSIVMLDTCQSGFVPGRRGVGADMDKVIENLAEQEGTVFISASRSTQAAQERSDWGHGAFTLAVKEALTGREAKDRDGNGVLDIGEFYDFVSDRVFDLTSGQQKPNMSGYQIEYFPIFAF